MSYLLYWNPDVIPEGPYNIAAVRFSSLVGVEYIRIVPAGCAPFINDPSIVGYVIALTCSQPNFYSSSFIQTNRSGRI